LAVIGLAGILKLTSLDGFARDTLAWQVFPPWMLAFATVAVPIVEVSLAGAWFLFARNTRLIWAAALLVAVMTAAFVVEARGGSVPKCGCFGLVSLYWAHKRSIESGIATNLILIGLLAVSAVPFRRPAPRERARTPSRFDHAAGFSLVEMLLVIVVIALLVALSLPALSSVRDSARRVSTVSTLSQHAKVFSMYANDYDDMFPYFTDPKATYSVLWMNDTPISIPYFAAYAYWSVALAPGYYNGDYYSSSFNRPGDPPAPSYKFGYSATLISRPEFWNPLTRRGPEQWMPTRTYEVVFPSSKGVLIDFTTWFPVIGDKAVELTPTTFVDASATALKRSSVSAPYSGGEGNWTGSWFHVGLPVFHTIDGIRGRDLVHSQ
jgi:prepilin-type N-terminal cleavage/methylation domain-containing protein